MIDHMEPVFWQNTLPIMVTILVAVGVATVAALISNSNMTKRLDDIIKRLERIEFKLDDYQQRIAKLEERTSILHH
jgi:predicted PurR-regulated permease PerM